MLKTLFTFFALVCFSLCAKAQLWEIGATGGAAGYVGDLNQTNILKVSGPAYGGYLKRNFDSHFSVKLQYMHGKIAGADTTSRYADNYNRNLSFITPLDELSAIGEFNFFSYRPGIDKHAFTPYFFLGGGFVSYNPTTRYQGQAYDLRQLTTEGQEKPYKSVALTIPFGAGIKYNVTSNISLIADAAYRYTATDYLDDVSGYYADKSKLGSDIAKILADRTGERTGIYTGTAGTQRGDFKMRDNYMFFSLSVAFTFIDQHCVFER